MAEKLDDFTFAPRGNQFAGLLDGSVWKVSISEDYPGYATTLTLLTGIRAAARLKGLRIRAKTLDSDTVAVQAYDPDKDWYTEGGHDGSTTDTT